MMSNLRNAEFWKVIVGLILVGFIYLWHIHAPLMWGDEAGTAIFGRNIIQKGVPVGFDGRNLSVFDNCASVSQTLLSKKIPRVEDYVASLSILAFGPSTMGVRLLFVIIGFCSFLPLYAVLKRETSHAALLTTLLLLTPQVVLFQRNARYYPLLILLFSLLMWTYTHRFKSEKCRMVLCCLLSLLFFHTHELAAFSSMLSFVILSLVKDRASLKFYVPAFLLGFVSWGIFYFSLKSVPGSSSENIQLLFDRPSQWVVTFLTGLKASVLDLDYINALPLLTWVCLLGVILSKKARGTILVPLGSPISLLILVNLAVQIVLDAALVGYETPYQYSLLRYMPHLVATCIIPLFLVVENLISHIFIKSPATKAWLAPLLCLAVSFSNISTFSYWFGSMPGRSSTPSCWPPVYSEILARGPDPFKTLVETLSREGARHEETVLAWPPYVNEILIYYLGDNYLIIPSFLENSACAACIVRQIGSGNYMRFKKMPKWVVFSRPTIQCAAWV